MSYYYLKRFYKQCDLSLCCITNVNSISALSYEEEGEDLGMQLKVLTLLDNPAVIVAAAASDEVGTLRDFLTKHPMQVFSISTFMCVFVSKASVVLLC